VTPPVPLMNSDERLHNVLLSTTLGPVTPFFGILNGVCECGKPKGEIKIRGKNGKLKSVEHKPGKHPLWAGWQRKNATTDPETISRWFKDFPNANFAVITGVDSVVLDLDIRPGKNGVEELARLEAESGQTVPATVTVMSGSGSGAKHLYFRVPPDVALLQTPKGTKAIDFQRSRKAIIIPGSLHESGHFYEYAPGFSPDDVGLAELPLWLLELMRKPSPSSRKTVGGFTTDIDELFAEMLAIGPPPGSRKPGRLRPDEIVKKKMAKVDMRKYPSDRSHSDSHWAWTLARNACHHWDQFLRIWKSSPIRELSDTKCGRASYEGPLLNRAFLDQKQQWESKLKRRPLEQSANPKLAAKMRKEASTRREVPRSPITTAVLALHSERPHLDDTGIAGVLNQAGNLDKSVTRNNVKRIRHSYPHLW
jgi:Bifunctional DNA primase/polymerase, N-terminal